MFESLNRLKPKTKQRIVGGAFVLAVIYSPQAYSALLFVCIVWSLLYVFE